MLQIVRKSLKTKEGYSRRGDSWSSGCKAGLGSVRSRLCHQASTAVLMGTEQVFQGELIEGSRDRSCNTWKPSIRSLCFILGNGSDTI